MRDVPPSLLRGVVSFSTAALLLAGAACNREDPSLEIAASRAETPRGAHRIDMAHAETFQVYERDGYRIVDLRAPLVSWGGAAQAMEFIWLSSCDQ